MSSVDEQGARRRQLYFNGAGEWSEESSNARLRMDSSLRLDPKAENRLMRSSDGGWVQVDDATALSGAERGLCFQVSPAPRGSRQLLSFSSARYIDRELMEGPLKGLDVLDERGLRSNNPLGLGERFLLTSRDAKSFAAAIKAMGGVLIRSSNSSPSLDSVALRIDEIDRDLLNLAESLEKDLDFLNSVAEGKFTGQMQFDQRGREFHDKAAESARSATNLKADIDDSAQAEQDSDVRARLLEFKSRADGALVGLEELRGGRQRVEHLLAEALRDKSVAPKVPAVTRQILFHDLASFAASVGANAQCNANGVELQLDDGTRISINENDGITVADSST